MNETFIRPGVMAFALLMEREMRINDAKRGGDGWLRCGPADVERLAQGVTRDAAKLLLAAHEGDLAKVEEQIADTANMLMMVAHAAGCLRVAAGSTPPAGAATYEVVPAEGHIDAALVNRNGKGVLVTNIGSDHPERHNQLARALAVVLARPDVDAAVAALIGEG
ncbi:hypothetical protein [Azospirillum tabaci]|uniref:hypothetical protein n=1 Tax=Azospirillum tabaci TaxID=2752310 RepID=UPI0016605E63|nr:hypothetical protein [Azospirillum tabaci]